MKKINIVYYLLFMLLILGAFAAMAQNGYGFDIIGFVCLVFGIVFLIRLVRLSGKGKKTDIWAMLEFCCLSAMAFGFALKSFHIYVAFLDRMLAISSLFLALVFAKRMIEHFADLKGKNTRLSYIILIYYSSLIVFLLAIASTIFFPAFSVYFETVAFLLMLVFVVCSFMYKRVMVDGSSRSVLDHLRAFRDSSMLLVCIFTIMVLYTGLTRVGLLPTMYSDDFPQAYFRMVNADNSKKETNGKYKHQEFKEQYEAFLKKNNLE